MKLLASGRDSDVFEYADGLVLRRYRDGRAAEQEAATIRAVVPAAEALRRLNPHQSPEELAGLRAATAPAVVPA